MQDTRITAPSAARNREPILHALRRQLPASGTVLEVASGTGEHVAYFAAALPGLQWQPTDPDADRRASIDAWIAGWPTSVRRFRWMRWRPGRYPRRTPCCAST